MSGIQFLKSSIGVLTHADKTLVSVQQQENHSHKRNNSKYVKADMGKDHAI